MFITDPFRFQKTLRLATSTRTLAVAAVAINLGRGLRVSLSLRTYTVAPVATSLRKSSRVVAGVRAVSVDAVSTRVLKGLKLSGTTRSYSVSPQASFLQRSRINGMTAAAYAITPQAAGLLFKHKLSAGAQSLAVQGIAASFLKVAGQLTANLQTMALAPVSTGLRKASRLYATLVTYAASPTAAALRRNYPITPPVRAFDIASVAASLKKGSLVSAVKADYNISTVSTTLTYTQNGVTLTYRGHGHVFGSSNTANLAAGYGNVDGGSAPVAGSLVVWIAAGFDTGSTPVVDLTGSGWSQQRSYASSWGSTIAAKVVVSGDISSPPNIVTAPTNGSVGFWVAYNVTGTPAAITVASLSGNYSGASAPSSQVVNSSGVASNAQVVTVAFGGGNDGSPNLTLTGATATHSYTTPGNAYCSTLESIFRELCTTGGVNVTFSKTDDTDGNHMVSGYVSVT